LCDGNRSTKEAVAEVSRSRIDAGGTISSVKITTDLQRAEENFVLEAREVYRGLESLHDRVEEESKRDYSS